MHTAPSTCSNPARPPLTLLLGPSGSGKTEALFARFAERPDAALLLTASPSQARSYAEALAVRMAQPAESLRPRILPLRTFAHRLASETAPRTRPISRTFQRLLLGRLAVEQIGPDDYFGRVRETPGFVTALTERVREWKLAGLAPEALAQSAHVVAEQLQDASFVRKAGELARLLRAYAQFLDDNDLHDDDDVLTQAVRRIENMALPLSDAPGAILVDGFYRFNPCQRELLAALARRGIENKRKNKIENENGRAEGEKTREVVVALSDDPTRPLLFAAPTRTLHTLRDEFTCTEIPLTSARPAAPSALHRLGTGLFASDVQPSSPTAAPSDAANDEGQEPQSRRQTTFATAAGSAINGVQIFDAPNAYVEAEMVAREFRRLHDSGQADWREFVVILRGMGDYAPILAAVFERYDIPLGVDGPEPLMENPLLKTLLTLLDVVRHGWQRDHVLAFVKSTYTPGDQRDADALRRLARRQSVRSGRDAWLRLAEGDTASNEAGEGHEYALSLPVRACLEQMAETDILLTSTPLAMPEFVRIVTDLVGQFGMADRIERGEPVRQQRDRAALAEATDVLRSLSQMAEIRGGTVRAPYAARHDELLTAWRGAASLPPSEDDRVRVAEPYDARERPCRVAAVMGLTERVFPRRILEDPFLRDTERLALCEQTGCALELQRLRADDERFLFYLAVTAPADRLILSFPRSADESDTLPSFYLDEVRAVFANRPGLTTISRTLADVAPLPQEVVTNADRLLAACAAIYEPNPLRDARQQQQEGLGLLQTCLQTETERSRIRAIFAARHLPPLPRLHDAALKRDFAAHKTRYNVSELELYGQCPFQYLLRHVLRLHPEADDRHERAQGDVLHSVLKRWFRRRRKQGKSDPGSLPPPDTMRAELHGLLHRTLEARPLDASPLRQQMTRRLLENALTGFVKREQRFAPQWNYVPTHFELAFGHDGTVNAESTAQTGGEERGEIVGTLDAASCTQPLVLMGTDGGPSVEICGTIDRVDVDGSGRRALLMDYKLGTVPDVNAMRSGQSLQMPLYLLALERVFGMTGAVACYDPMRQNGRPRLHRTEHASSRQFAPLLPHDDGPTVTPLNREQYADLLQVAEATTLRLVRSIGTANVEATPGDHCVRCDYRDVCRTTVIYGHDGE